MITNDGDIVMCRGCEFSGDIPPGVCPTTSMRTTETRTNAGVLVLIDEELRLSSQIVDSKEPSIPPKSVRISELIEECSDRNSRCRLAQAGYVPVEISHERKRSIVESRVQELKGVKLLGEALVLWES